MGRLYPATFNIELKMSNLETRLRALVPQFIIAAQACYDEWDGEDGGACDLIADSLAGVLINHGIDYTPGGHDGDDHAYMIAYDTQESFTVDIDPSIYEVGMGYAWTKIENVTFEADDIDIFDVQRPDWIPDENTKTD